LYGRLSAYGLISLLLLTLLCVATPSRSLAAAGAGRISGQLLNGSDNKTPIAGQSVTLQMAQGANARDLASVKTDARGRYAFPQLATDKSISYALYSNYMGAQYNSSIVNLAARPVQQVNLTVYTATSSTASIAIVRATILLRQPDAQKGSVSVSELYIFRNLGSRTYVGSLDASRGKPDALLFSLPHTARNVSLSSGFSGYDALQVNNGIATSAALPPGDAQFAFTFDMPYFASPTYDFDYTVNNPTVQLTLLLPPSLHGSSSELASHGPVKSGQASYTLWQAAALSAGREVHVELSGLPVITPPQDAPSPTFDAARAWLIIVFLLLLAVVLLATGLIYRRMRPAPAAAARKAHRAQRPGRASGRQQQSRAKSAAAPAPAGQHSQKEQALLQELLELDRAFEAGTLSKSVYQERRAQAKGRLRALLMSEKVTS
jgi:hypothetical protein